MELSQSAPFAYPVLMISSADHVTGATGLTLAISLSKAGSAFAAIAPVVVERGFGWYTLQLTSAETDTLGAFAQHITAPGADPFDALDEVVATTEEIPPSAPSATLLIMLKRTRGISLRDTSQDVYLSQLLSAALTSIEGFTKRYFGLPSRRVEYRDATGCDEMCLHGHIDDSVLADNPSETLDPTTSLVVERRTRRPFGVGTEWELLTEGTDWERRDQCLVYLGEMGVWWAEYEYRLTYMDGYADLPDDLKLAVVEIASSQFALDARQSDASGGIKSETLGDFSYSLDLASIGAGGNTLLSDSAKRTLNRYKRMLA